MLSEQDNEDSSMSNLRRLKKGIAMMDANV